MINDTVVAYRLTTSAGKMSGMSLTGLGMNLDGLDCGIPLSFIIKQITM